MASLRTRVRRNPAPGRFDEVVAALAGAACSVGATASDSARWRTCSTFSKSKPGMPSSDPSTRITFQPGRAWPAGRTAPLKLCSRPSQLMKDPPVSVNGAMGSRQSATAIRSGEA